VRPPDPRAAPPGRRHWPRTSTAPPTRTGRGRSDPVRRPRSPAGAGWPASATAGRDRSARGWPTTAAGRPDRSDTRADPRGECSPQRCCHPARTGCVRPPCCHAPMTAPPTNTAPTHPESTRPGSTRPGSTGIPPGRTGVVRVLGGPGTGKSTLLVETAAAHIRAGAAPESVLLLTGSARLGAQARAAVTARLLRAATGRGAVVVREPMVRTVHSYAFAVLRLAAQRTGGPPPRLLTSAEQDAIVRELLAGDLEDGAASPVRWPAALRPALSTAGFAKELRDLLARCTERGVDPLALQRLGRRLGRPE